MEMAQQPMAGVRISATYASGARWVDLPLLQLTATSIVDIEEIWLITDDGLPVFVDPALAPFLEETVLCSAQGVGASLSFLLAFDPPVTISVKARRSAARSRLKSQRRRPRAEGA